MKDNKRFVSEVATKSVLIISSTIFCLFSIPSVFAEVEVDASIGLGHDSNIYKTPRSDYYDPNSPVVPNPINGYNIFPTNYGGWFIPYNFKFSGSQETAPDTFFVGSYKLKGYRYLSNKYSNANRTDHKFSAGVKRLFEKNGVREKYLEGDLLVGHQKRLYLDRDTGENHPLSSTSNKDVSQRYTYDYTGFELLYKDRISPWQKKAALHIEKRDYFDVPGVNESQYDNTYTAIKLGVDKRLNKPLKLGIDFNHYIYDFVERKARNASGTLNGPPRKYTYEQLKMALRYRMSKAWLHIIKLEYKTRKDHHVGYDDYTKTLFGFTSQWDVSHADRVKISLDSWNRKYDNAFAFDVAGQADKSYDGTTLELEYIREINQQWNINALYQNIVENSSDSRYEYKRSVFSVAAEYNFKQ